MKKHLPFRLLGLPIALSTLVAAHVEAQVSYETRPPISVAGRGLGIGDVGGVGPTHLLTATNDAIVAFVNDGAANFTPVSTPILAALGPPTDMVSGDPFGALVPRVLLARSGTFQIWVPNVPFDGTYSPELLGFAVAFAPTAIVFADVDGDTIGDVLAVDNDVLYVFPAGAIPPFTLFSTTTLTTMPGVEHLGITTFQSAGTVHAAVTQRTTNSVVILENDGSGVFAPAQIVRVGTAPVAIEGLSIGGTPTLAVSSQGGGGGPGLTVQILQPDPMGDFQIVETHDLPGNASRRIRAADLDGDGDLDLAASSDQDGVGGTTLLFQEPVGGQIFGITQDLQFPSVYLAVADFDGNGSSDLALQSLEPSGLIGDLTVLLASDQPLFIRGDFNGDGVLNIVDVLGILDYLFDGGPPPTCLDAIDVNDDGSLNLFDPLHLSNYLFQNGPAPLPPFPAPGFDPTPDTIRCQ